MYTCNTCQLQFPEAEGQRSHMKSDWHRYNLKRRVAGLPSIDEAMFNEKVSKLSQAEEDGKKQKSEKEKNITKKEQRKREKEALLEKKRQLLELAKQNMLKSMKQGETENQNDKPAEATVTEQLEELKVEDEEKQEEELTPEQQEEKLLAEKLANGVEIEPEVCLFCNKKFPHFEACCTHMFKYHGFYIPEQNFLTDKLGLVKYMSEKIGLGNVCIVCNYQGRSLEAVRAHMLAKRHCSIPYESENEKLEISEFYDFSSTYKELDGEDDQWEDVDDEGELVGSDEEEADDDEPLPEQVSYNDGVELHLPSGVKVGHRAYARYFRQNLRPETVLSEGQGTVIAAESRHLASVHDRQALLEKKRIWRHEKSDLDRNDRRAQKNINNQPHYRDQLLQ
ncbi:REI1 [Cyberlindnera jadinii]|uniref:REI1 protein n=1 Tax=Cyberlindnera jadinii (strain ATCC 18201 / CBS 1600 / BCRC 20928 / JCM 3617 / NBRC 0987 / NRRL Y-1542) TaxID=983966 RepID=A0A0H5C5B0_CYBJN|nr:REI1 [Cyberlindnera jadinii]